MIKFELDENKSIALIHANQSDSLSENDFKKLTARIDAYLEGHDSLQGIVIIAENFPGWESFDTFISHMKFIHDHHKSINKIAIVSDSGLLSAMPSIATHFVKAQVRNFAAADIEQAKEWARTKEPRSGRFIVLDGYVDDVIALKAEGNITGEDYTETLIPLAEAAIKAHGKVKLLYWCGEEFSGFSAGAAWDDARFGISHMGDFSKIAFVSDVGWLRESVKLFGPLLSAPVQVFANSDVDKTKDWIAAD